MVSALIQKYIYIKLANYYYIWEVSFLEENHAAKPVDGIVAALLTGIKIKRRDYDSITGRGRSPPRSSVGHGVPIRSGPAGPGKRAGIMTV